MRTIKGSEEEEVSSVPLISTSERVGVGIVGGLAEGVSSRSGVVSRFRDEEGVGLGAVMMGVRSEEARACMEGGRTLASERDRADEGTRACFSSSTFGSGKGK